MGTVLTLTPNPALDLWLTTPEFEAGPKLRTGQVRVDPGGGGVNVSRALHRLGGATRALYASGGRRGAELCERLDHEGIPAERCVIEGHTRQNISVCEETSGDVLRFVTPGPRIRSEEAEALLTLLERNTPDASLVVGSGSLPEGAGDAFWARAAAICKRADARFILDSHDAVELALDEGLFCYRENRDALSGLAGHELGWPEETADWAGKKVDEGAAEMVIVTEGSRGALLVTAEFRFLQHPPDVTPRSAIGAGDSFVAGLCLALSREEGLEEALRRAVATAAATLLTPGTELCRKEDVDRLLSDIGEMQRI
ncbi:MAG: 1-phosphofructokinase family hexose kinase [Roseicyclus sp.]